MLFDAQIQVAAIEAVAMPDGHVQLALVPALTIPGSQGAVPLPLGFIRIGISRDAAQTLSDDLAKVATETPEEPAKKPSDLVVATSMAGVDEAAVLNDKFKGK